MKMIRTPSHGTIAAYAALFVSLGGTAVALESGSITSREIARGAVGKSEVEKNAVARSELRTGAVNRSEIRRGAVGVSEIREDAVRTPEIQTGAVTAAELADDSVGRTEVADGAVGAQALADGAVNTTALFDGAVTRLKIADDAVDGASVVDGSLALTDLAQEVATVTIDPPVLNVGDCTRDNALAVPNKQAGDVALVLPGTEPAGWHPDLTLDAYSSSGSAGPNTISVVVCRQFGAGALDPVEQPLRVLLFR